ncbi:Uncharacterised protein [Mycobacteroides abscessus subsp. abscessus]|nr:Uncharacterised protein [Mycobacteroides abscessus subsp. abscessus]
MLLKLFLQLLAAHTIDGSKQVFKRFKFLQQLDGCFLSYTGHPWDIV